MIAFFELTKETLKKLLSKWGVENMSRDKGEVFDHLDCIRRILKGERD